MKRSRRNAASATKADSNKVARMDVTNATGGQPKDEVCHIDRLPDHLVVRIFTYLDHSSVVFLLPQICKRWSGLACAEELWKDCNLYYSSWLKNYEKKLFFKCLKMAPSLHSLTLDVDYKHGTEFALKFNVDSPREIKAVTFTYDNMPPEVMFTLLRKYKSSLEKLVINDTFTPYVESDVKRIWTDIQNLSKLKHLVIDGVALLYHKASFRKNAPCWKTLQILDVKDSSYEEMNTVQKLVSVNPNWKEVYLSTTDETLFRGEVKALAKCPNLECIQVPFCKELKYLENFEKLDSLIIDCVTATASEVNGVITALSKSTPFPNLKKVKMVNATSPFVKLLQFLVGGRPEIILLNLVSCEMDCQELISILKCMSGLESLYLHEMGSKSLLLVLDEIGNGIVPKIKKLCLSECFCDEKTDPAQCLKFASDCLQLERPELQLQSDILCECKQGTKDSVGKESNQQEAKKDSKDTASMKSDLQEKKENPPNEENVSENQKPEDDNPSTTHEPGCHNRAQKKEGGAASSHELTKAQDASCHDKSNADDVPKPRKRGRPKLVSREDKVSNTKGPKQV